METLSDIKKTPGRRYPELESAGHDVGLAAAPTRWKHPWWWNECYATAEGDTVDGGRHSGLETHPEDIVTRYASDTEPLTGSRLRVRRSRGAFSGLLLVILGAWGALIPFVGPYFDFGFLPDSAWDWSGPRFWFELLPGLVTVVGGLMILAASDRFSLSIGSWLAVAAGAWFVVGQQLSQLVDLGTLGGPISTGDTAVALQNLLILYALGVVIVLFGALVQGRASIVGVADVRASARAAEAAAARHTDPVVTDPKDDPSV